MTATAPLSASSSSVRTAATLLPLRSTLVAPGLPEPYDRGSSRRIARDTITAKLSDPSRYASTTPHTDQNIATDDTFVEFDDRKCIRWRLRAGVLRRCRAPSP